MGHATQIGKFTLLISAACIAYGQTPPTTLQCVPSAVPTQVRAEGVTERMGNLLLQCSGAAGAMVSGNLTIYLPISITNRVNDNNQALDATLLVNVGTGFVPTNIAGTVSAASI